MLNKIKLTQAFNKIAHKTQQHPIVNTRKCMKRDTFMNDYDWKELSYAWNANFLACVSIDSQP